MTCLDVFDSIAASTAEPDVTDISYLLSRQQHQLTVQEDYRT
jgi:hypothetical protein